VSNHRIPQDPGPVAQSFPLGPHGSKKIWFDPTVNLGHILTFLGFIFSIFVGWTILDKRVTVLEEQRRLQAQIDQAQDSMSSQNLRQIYESLSDIKKSVEKIGDRQTNNQGLPR